MKKWTSFWCVLLLSFFFVQRVKAVSVNCQYVQASGQPTGMDFDTIHGTIWVALYGSGDVAEINTSTCNLVALVAVGTNPEGVAFDAGDQAVWVTNYGSNTVSKIDANQAVVVQTVNVGAGPRGIVYDGLNLWVANYGSNTVTKIYAPTGQVQATISVGSGPYFPAIDGNGFIWVPNRNSNSVTIINPSTSTGTSVATDSQPQFVTREGIYMWVSCYSSQKVDQFQVNSPGTPPTLIRKVTAPHSNPTGLAGVSGGVIGVTWSGYIYDILDSDGSVHNVNSLGGNHWTVLPQGNSFVWDTNTSAGATNKLIWP